MLTIIIIAIIAIISIFMVIRNAHKRFMDNLAKKHFAKVIDNQLKNNPEEIAYVDGYLSKD